MMFKLIKEYRKWLFDFIMSYRSWQVYGLPKSDGYCFVGDRLVGYDFDTSYGLSPYTKCGIIHKVKINFKTWRLFLKERKK